METTEKIESTDKMAKVNELTNQLLDSPKIISEKLPWNNWTSCVEDSENRIAGWIGKVFQVLALASCIMILFGTLEKLWENSGKMWQGETEAIISAVLSILLWTCAAFPIAQIIRNIGDSLGSSKSNTIGLVFLDLPVAMIKMAGYILAMMGLFVAISALLSFITTLNIVNAMGMDLLVLTEMGSMGTAILFGLLNDLGMTQFGEMMTDMMAGPNMGYGGAWTVAGAIGVFGSFISIVVILVNLYINVMVYQFLYGLASTLVKWLKAPYLPFKSL
ncbi:MAG: hypothetical protein QNK85_01065 [Crocinitomicaceae bacterium]